MQFLYKHHYFYLNWKWYSYMNIHLSLGKYQISCLKLVKDLTAWLELSKTISQKVSEWLINLYEIKYMIILNYANWQQNVGTTMCGPTMCENWNSEILKNIAQITNKAHKY